MGIKENKLFIDNVAYLVHNNELVFGGVPERSKGSDCKSDGTAFGGSNPPPSTKHKFQDPDLG